MSYYIHLYLSEKGTWKFCVLLIPGVIYCPLWSCTLHQKLFSPMSLWANYSSLNAFRWPVITPNSWIPIYCTQTHNSGGWESSENHILFLLWNNSRRFSRIFFKWSGLILFFSDSVPVAWSWHTAAMLKFQWWFISTLGTGAEPGLKHCLWPRCQLKSLCWCVTTEVM